MRFFAKIRKSDIYSNINNFLKYSFRSIVFPIDTLFGYHFYQWHDDFR